MLIRQLHSVCRKRFSKSFSTVPSPKTRNELPEAARKERISREDEVLQHPDYFRVHNLFTVKDLFNAKVHYGHKVSSLHPNMKPFIFGERLGHVIFDLDVTAFHLREALNFVAHIAYRDGIILFVSKNPRMTLLVEKTARECKEFAVAREWRFGLLTSPESMFRTEIRLPDTCIILNMLEENGFQHHVVHEAARLCIPTVGVVDSNCNPNLITYPIPGNDDSPSSFELYCKVFKEAILRGKNEREKDLGKQAESESTDAVNTNEVETATATNQSQ